MRKKLKITVDRIYEKYFELTGVKLLKLFKKRNLKVHGSRKAPYKEQWSYFSVKDFR